MMNPLDRAHGMGALKNILRGLIWAVVSGLSIGLSACDRDNSDNSYPPEDIKKVKSDLEKKLREELKLEKEKLKLARQKLQSELHTALRSKTGHNHIHLRFENRMPWFAESKQALFTSMVVFPKEAKATEYGEGEYASCPPQKCELKSASCSHRNICPKVCKVDAGSAAVCPDKGFYRDMFIPFLRGLSECGRDDAKVVLQTVGFASRSGLKRLNDPQNDPQEKNSLISKLQRKKTLQYGGKEVEKSCLERAGSCGMGKGACKPDDKGCLSRAFNLCMAELRAENVKTMLEKIIRDEELDRSIEVTTKPWCSYYEMSGQLGFADITKNAGDERGHYDTELGLMNRRVEVRVVALPGCLNISSENRICTGKGCRKNE